MFIILGLAAILALLYVGYRKFFAPSNKYVSIGGGSALYDISKPDAKYVMPKKLKEISGISYANDRELYCVNDEKGKIYVYDLVEKDITNTIEFGDEGDYEGVEVVANTVFVMASSGLIKAFNLADNSMDSIDCQVDEVAEFEGFAYDSASDSLLLAAKEMEGDKAIFACHLPSKKLSKAYHIEKDMIKANEFGKEFKPSGLAVHPTSGHLYILASAGKKMLVMDRQNTVLSQYNIDENILAQPEGLCFGADGSLFISSEGKNGDGLILQYKPNLNLS